MEDDTHELPVCEIIKGVEVYGGQSVERIAEAKRQIGLVIRLRDPLKLCEFACDAGNAPEARNLARAKALASVEVRQKSSIDADYLSAYCTGIARIEPVMGRLIGHWAAADGPAPWPTAWMPP
jgi:hypothetical protein